MNIKILFILLCLFVAPYEALAENLKISLNSALISEQEPALLSVHVTDDKNPDIHLPEIAGLHFSARGRSSQTSWVNGTITSAVTEQFLVSGSPGEYQIQVHAEIDGKIQASNTVSLKIIAYEDAIQQGETAFIELTLPEKSYFGQKIPLEIQAYFPHNQDIELNSVPRLIGNDLQMAISKENPQQTTVEKDGNIYTLLAWKATLTGVSSGRYPLSVQMGANLITKTKSHDPFSAMEGMNDPFFSSMFSTTRRTPFKIISEEKSITIESLPIENKPENFKGAVGKFHIKVTPSTINAEVGEPIQLEISILGTGNFEQVHAPGSLKNTGWKLYPHQRVEGEWEDMKKFTQVIIAQETGILDLPQYSFSYFDPEKAEYKEVYSNTQPIKIVPPSDAGSNSMGNDSNTVTLVPTEKMDEKTDAGQMAPLALIGQHDSIGKNFTQIEPLSHKPLYVFLCGLTLFFILIALVRIVVTYKKQNSPRKYAQRVLYKKINSALLSLEKNLEAPKNEDTLRKLLQSYYAFHLEGQDDAFSATQLKGTVFEGSPMALAFAQLDKSRYGGSQEDRIELLKTIELLKQSISEKP